MERITLCNGLPVTNSVRISSRGVRLDGNNFGVKLTLMTAAAPPVCRRIGRFNSKRCTSTDGPSGSKINPGKPTAAPHPVDISLPFTVPHFHLPVNAEIW